VGSSFARCLLKAARRTKALAPVGSAFRRVPAPEAAADANIARLNRRRADRRLDRAGRGYDGELRNRAENSRWIFEHALSAEDGRSDVGRLKPGESRVMRLMLVLVLSGCIAVTILIMLVLVLSSGG
jgi:hypothetical protein